MDKTDFTLLTQEGFHPLFAFKGIGYLFAQHFLYQYSQHDTLTIYDKGFFRSFIFREGMNRTLQEGLELFSDREKFDAYLKDFEVYLEKARQTIDRFTDKENITESDWIDLSTTLKEIWVYHDKTEAIFTDLAFSQSKENTLLQNNLQRLGEIKFPSSEILHKLGLDIFYRVLDMIATQFRVAPQDIKFFSEDEVKNLFSGKMPEQEIVERRQRAYILYGTGGKIEEPNFEETKKVIEQFRPKNLDTRELHGTSASLGKVEGRARVILADYSDDFRAVENQIAEMQEGEILVTENTTVQFMVILRKAVAIITNQGGLNSHAAITSRELHIPCIVAVSDATEIIRTGDRISVSAEKNDGIIHILSRNNS
ncbi:MAG: hypothetical protein IPJ68_03290 [Candidatus Moraniibacteriota bacterium]|nr:MAG: hypothetical protein IPJ68_03290 [Candidatus Moranbacteria bacterium]